MPVFCLAFFLPYATTRFTMVSMDTTHEVVSHLRVTEEVGGQFWSDFCDVIFEWPLRTMLLCLPPSSAHKVSFTLKEPKKYCKRFSLFIR